MYVGDTNYINLIKEMLYMKRALIVTMMVIGLTTGSVFAYSNNIKMNTEQYVSMLNTYISEMNVEVEAQEKATLGNILLEGMDNGYIIPSINNDTKLKNCISGLMDNIKETKIVDKDLQNKHISLMDQMKELVKLLNNTIQCKKDILNSNDKSLVKGQKLLSEDEEKIKLVNEKINSINQTYNEINNFIK